MRHLAVIQREFLKEARKWDDLSLEEQKTYLKRHPKSKRRVTAKLQTDTSIKSKKQKQMLHWLASNKVAIDSIVKPGDKKGANKPTHSKYISILPDELQKLLKDKPFLAFSADAMHKSEQTSLGLRHVRDENRNLILEGYLYNDPNDWHEPIYKQDKKDEAKKLQDELDSANFKSITLTSDKVKDILAGKLETKTSEYRQTAEIGTLKDGTTVIRIKQFINPKLRQDSLNLSESYEQPTDPEFFSKVDYYAFDMSKEK